MTSFHSNRVTALADVADIRLGISFRARLEHQPAGDLAIMQMKDITESGLSYSSAVRGAFPELKADSLLRAGDLVFRSRGRSTGAALVGTDVPPAILAAPLLLIRPLHILPEFLHWFINSDVAQSHLASVAAGTSVQMVSAESLRALPVPLPPSFAQLQIAEVAGLIRREAELMNHLANRRRQLTNHILMTFAYATAKGVTR